MKSLWVLLICLICGLSGAVQGEERITKEDISAWAGRGVEQNATHLIVVGDRLNHFIFPEYVFRRENLLQIVNFWETEMNCAILEIYDLDSDLNAQLEEVRAWHPESSAQEEKEDIALIFDSIRMP